VVELGLVGKTMHMVDERAPVAEIRQLQAVYERVIARYFAAPKDAAVQGALSANAG
jgi:succinyl-diaminopimelate desuccinylase